jgi:cobalt-zinc-cadmium efflux system outer membrane protein
MLVGTLEIGEQELLNEDTVLQEILACSPQLRAAWAEVDRDRIGVQRELAEPIPNVQLRAETGYNFESSNTVAGVSVGFKLPIWDKNQGTVFQARAELARAEADVARIELMLRRKFGETFADYEAALIEARSFEKESLPKAREAYESYLDSFKNRRAAWPQVLVAQREYFQLTDEYLETLRELRGAEANITGFFLGDGLEQPPEPPPQGHRDATPRPR